MALIPITFKADLGEESQKGNVRPEDLGALFSMLYPNNAGILNFNGLDCSQFGAINVIGNTAQLTFHAGYIVIYGRAIYIEEGTQVKFNLPTSGSVSGVLGVKIDLAENGENEVSWFQKFGTPQTDNLIANSASGIYEFVLYDYNATPTTLTLTKKTNEIINNVPKQLTENFEAKTYSYKSGGLTLKLYKNVGSKIVYGSLDGNVRVNREGFYDSFMFYVTDDDFLPNENVVLFDTGPVSDVAEYPVIAPLAFGDNGEICYAQVRSGGVMLPNGRMGMTTYGVRHGDATSTKYLRVHFYFSYLAKN